MLSLHFQVLFHKKYFWVSIMHPSIIISIVFCLLFLYMPVLWSQLWKSKLISIQRSHKQQGHVDLEWIVSMFVFVCLYLCVLMFRFLIYNILCVEMTRFTQKWNWQLYGELLEYLKLNLNLRGIERVLNLNSMRPVFLFLLRQNQLIEILGSNAHSYSILTLHTPMMLICT